MPLRRIQRCQWNSSRRTRVNASLLNLDPQEAKEVSSEEELNSWKEEAQLATFGADRVVLEDGPEPWARVKVQIKSN
jgi:hypothetical protein